MARRIASSLAALALSSLPALALSSLSPAAAAQDLADLPAGSAVVPTTRDGISESAPYWEGSGRDRFFMSANFELAAIRYQPNLALGYGKPHFRWFGIETYGSLSINGGRVYGGVRGVWPGISARFGARYEFPTSQFFLPIQETYTRYDLETRRTQRSRYIAGEAEITGSIPIPHGNIFAVANGYYLTDIPADLYVFEQTLRVVAGAPWLWRARAGYLAHFGSGDTFRIGAAAEIIGIVERQNHIVRAGPVMSVTLTHHMEAIGAIMVVARSADSLGLVGADLGQIGLRYRWSTGDRFPEFP